MAKRGLYFVQVDRARGRTGRILGYRVCFEREPGSCEIVEYEPGGYFAIRGRGWRLALHLANALRDDLNTGIL